MNILRAHKNVTKQDEVRQTISPTQISDFI